MSEFFLLSTVAASQKQKAEGGREGTLYTIDPNTAMQSSSVGLRGECAVQPFGLAFEDTHFTALCRDSASFQVFQWDREKPLSRFYGHERLACLVACEGYTLAGAVNGNLLVWESLTGELLQVVTNAHFQAVVKLCVQGSLVASAGRDGLVKVWDVHQIVSGKHPEPRFTVSAHQNAISDVCFLYSGRLVTCAEKEQVVHLHDQDGTPLAKFRFPEPIKRLQMGALETCLYAAGTQQIFLIDFERDYNQMQVEAWCHQESKPTLELNVHEDIVDMVLSLDDEHLAVLTKANLQLWSCSNRVMLKKTTPFGTNETPTGIYCAYPHTTPLPKAFKFTPFNRQFKDASERVIPPMTASENTSVDSTTVKELKQELERMKRMNATLVEFISKKSFLS